ncbi:MAG: hypothetical protein WCE80_02810 [Acidimicrobiia bacterium]
MWVAGREAPDPFPGVAGGSTLLAGDMDRRPEFDTDHRRGSVGACPDCGGSRAVTIREVDIVAFLCEDCGTCWRIELGWVHRVRSPLEDSPDD